MNQTVNSVEAPSLHDSLVYAFRAVAKGDPSVESNEKPFFRIFLSEAFLEVRASKAAAVLAHGMGIGGYNAITPRQIGHAELTGYGRKETSKGNELPYLDFHPFELIEDNKHESAAQVLTNILFDDDYLSQLASWKVREVQTQGRVVNMEASRPVIRMP